MYHYVLPTWPGLTQKAQLEWTHITYSPARKLVYYHPANAFDICFSRLHFFVDASIQVSRRKFTSLNVLSIA
jgi:hypothetical protein